MAERSVIRIALLVCGLALIAGLAAATDYLAIGDSITAGSSWPGNCMICPVVFDCTGNCSATKAGREKCGYVRRLDAWLGAGNDVINEGQGAENSMEAKIRLPSEMNAHCDDPEDCVAVILMHGTNDMFHNVSPETVRNNLQSMINTAKARDVDVLLMSIIREVYDLNDQDWQDYRDLTAALAATEDLQFVDNHAELCDVFSCYRRNYWIDGDLNDDGVDEQDEGPNDCTAPGEGDVTLGHPDPDGYTIMTDLIKDEFPASTPAAPNPTSPSGTIMETQPDFVWPEISTARWYELEVDGERTWWEEAVHCSGGTCTVDPGEVLAEGAHSWRVRGRNLRGMGSWSADEDFEVQTLVPPGAPTPVGPAGSVFVSAPLYQWTTMPTATEYDLEVRDSGGTLEAQASSIPSSNCNEAVCSFVEGTELMDPDVYTLKVLARNAAGQSLLSEPGLDFTVLDCADATQKDLQELAPPPVGTQTVEHCGPVTAAALGAYEIEEAGVLTVHSRDGFTAFDGFSVLGDLIVISP